MKPIPLYQWFAKTVQHHANCHVGTINQKWADITERRIEEAVKNGFPSGSGFDCGTKFNLKDHFDEKGQVKPYLKFVVDFHHMNGDGFYTGWTSHTVTVRPDLANGFSLSVSGRNHDGIKDYIGEVFYTLLGDEVTEFVPENEPSENYEFRRLGMYLASADYKN